MRGFWVWGVGGRGACGGSGLIVLACAVGGGRVGFQVLGLEF